MSGDEFGVEVAVGALREKVEALIEKVDTMTGRLEAMQATMDAMRFAATHTQPPGG